VKFLRVEVSDGRGDCGRRGDGLALTMRGTSSTAARSGTLAQRIREVAERPTPATGPSPPRSKAAVNCANWCWIPHLPDDERRRLARRSATRSPVPRTRLGQAVRVHPAMLPDDLPPNSLHDIELQDLFDCRGR